MPDKDLPTSTTRRVNSTQDSKPASGSRTRDRAVRRSDSGFLHVCPGSSCLLCLEDSGELARRWEARLDATMRRWAANDRRVDRTRSNWRVQ